MRIASYIDHTILKATTQLKDVQKLVQEAKDHGFAAVCVPPVYVQECKRLLAGSSVKLATVIGFPFGYHSLSTKLEECNQAILDGADELDMVMNIAALKNQDLSTLEKEAAAISNKVKKEGRVLKVIIESGILSDQEIIQCCSIYAQAGVDFVKTSTGFAERSASVEAVQLMRAHLPSSIQIKASGGIRDLHFAKQLVEAGATRLGCSASVAIVKEEENQAS
jgi:deoxyribose-phosphate aldolase